MFDPENYIIPPCCIAHRLPPRLRDGGAGCFFASNGDWGIKDLWNAASETVPSTYTYGEKGLIQRGDVFCFLSLEDVDASALRVLTDYMRRHWVQGLALMTASDAELLVRQELKGLEDRLWLVCGRKEAECSQMWIRSAESGSLVITGPIHHGKGTKHFCQYAASLTADAHRAIDAFIPYRSIFRRHAVVKGTDAVFDKWLKQ